MRVPFENKNNYYPAAVMTLSFLPYSSVVTSSHALSDIIIYNLYLKV